MMLPILVTLEYSLRYPKIDDLGYSLFETSAVNEYLDFGKDAYGMT